MPGAMAPSGRPLACAPPASAASSSSAAGMRLGLGRRDGAGVSAQALAGLELAQLVARRGADMAVGADAEAARRPPR